jgi:NADPH-dependent 2,4-dienoyl-CoA reductase/sulfur reductase-like enzyme/nitrite reductase/ring-hydroxylating ferredoxin subunit
MEVLEEDFSMSGEEAQLSGPDLAAGIALADLPDGGSRLGHLAGEAVLVVRRGEEVFAIGATCTHYGGPLAEGVVVGGKVRCPWHHAAFSLRTGEAVRAPALNPVACYKVERSGDRIIIGEKIGEKVEASPKQQASGPDPILIVGAGAAGNAAAEALRRAGYAGTIRMLGAENEPPYDRPNLSKDYLAGSAPEEWIPLHPQEFYAEHRIELALGSRVAAIDPKAQTVTLTDGHVHNYGALLLATGAEPIRLAIPGADLPHVHLLRSLADSRALIAAAKGAKRAVVIGASFIGLEAAAALRARGVAVTVVAPEELPLGRILGPELGGFLRSLHEEHGVSFRLGRKPASITPSEVRLDDGSAEPADLVVMGVGVRPRLELAESAGLAIDKGVVVDEFLQTSAPGVFAAGDIARWPDPWSGEPIRVEHWVVAERQGQVAAENLLGGRRPFDHAPFFWSQHYDVSISYVGHAVQWDAIEVTGSIAEKSAVLVFRSGGGGAGGRIAAVVTLSRDRESLEAEIAMEAGDADAVERAVRGEG